MRVSMREFGIDQRAAIVSAGIPVRLAARAVDVFVVLVVLLVGSLVPGGSESATATWATAGLVAVGITFCEAGLLRLYGRTPGMALLGLRVVTPTGTPLTMWRAVLRAALVWSEVVAVGVLPGATGAATLTVVLLGLIAPMRIRRDHRGLHDLIAGSVVDVP
jgi:uncharacterized RDD family membrane protein YckC